MSTAVTVIAVLAAFVPLAFVAIAATKRTGEQKARADVLDVNITGVAAQLADMTTRHKEQKERADKLSDLHAKMLVEMAGLPSAGSYQRLLSLIAAAQGTPAGDRQGGVPAPEPTEPGLDSRLLSPGE